MKSAKPFSLKNIAIAALLVTSTAFVHAQEQNAIGRSQIDTMFATMRDKAPFNVDGPLLWGYYWLGADREKLEQIGAEMTGQGYRVVGINAQKSAYQLHIEKVETHTPASLDALDQKFYAVAKRYGVTYGGMDVGPVASPVK